jgi:hypothetical protein
METRLRPRDEEREAQRSPATERDGNHSRAGGTAWRERGPDRLSRGNLPLGSYAKK